MSTKNPQPQKTALNRRARHDYTILETLEAGIVLTGSEVKSLRMGGGRITESYVSLEGGELWLINGHIAAYSHADAFGHEERRKRKLLVRKRERAKFAIALRDQGTTIIPLKLFFNERGRVKLEIALAKGKTNPDKREDAAKRDWAREKQRLLKQGRQAA